MLVDERQNMLSEGIVCALDGNGEVLAEDLLDLDTD